MEILQLVDPANLPREKTRGVIQWNGETSDEHVEQLIPHLGEDPTFHVRRQDGEVIRNGVVLSLVDPEAPRLARHYERMEGGAFHPLVNLQALAHEVFAEIRAHTSENGIPAVGVQVKTAISEAPVA